MIQGASMTWCVCSGDPNGYPPPGNSGTQLASTGPSSTVVTMESGRGQVRGGGVWHVTSNNWTLQGSQPQPPCFLAMMVSTHQLGRGMAGPGAEKAAAHPPVPTAATTTMATAATAAAAEQARQQQHPPLMTGAAREAEAATEEGPSASRPGPPAPGSGGPLTRQRSGRYPPPTPGSRPPPPQVVTPPAPLLSMAMATLVWLLCAMRPRPMAMTEEEAIMARGAASGDPGSSPAQRSSTPTNPHSSSSDPIITNDNTNHKKTSAPDQLMPKLAPSISSSPTSYELVTQVMPLNDVIFIAQIKYLRPWKGNFKSHSNFLAAKYLGTLAT